MNHHRACPVHLLSLSIYLASASFVLGADEPIFSEQQKIDFMQHAEVIKSRERCSARKGLTATWLLTLSSFDRRPVPSKIEGGTVVGQDGADRGNRLTRAVFSCGAGTRVSRYAETNPQRYSASRTTRQTVASRI